MASYISLGTAVILVLAAIVLWVLFGPFGLLLLVLAAVLFYYAFRAPPAVVQTS